MAGWPDAEQSNVAVSGWQIMEEADKTPFRPYPVPVALAAVRLVAPLADPATGEVRDTIVNALRVERKTFHQGIGIPERRFVAGVRPLLQIPFPPRDEYGFDDAPVDTLRLEVENRSWTPTLSVPPMPPAVIDELRNKYSALRSRHDDAWVAAKDAEHFARLQRRARTMQNMISPLEELAAKKQAEKSAKGEPALDDDTLAAIGQVMARNLSLGPKAAGTSAVSGVEMESSTA